MATRVEQLVEAAAVAQSIASDVRIDALADPHRSSGGFIGVGMVTARADTVALTIAAFLRELEYVSPSIG